MSRRGDTRRVEKSDSYLFEIASLMPTYSFHVGYERVDPGGFGEHLHIELTAKCVRPRKLEGRMTDFTFLGSREVIPETLAMPKRGYPNGVGTLTMRGGQSDYLGTLPYDVATVLPLIVLAGGYRFIYLFGPPLYRGSSRIKSSSFYREYDPTDLEP